MSTRRTVSDRIFILNNHLVIHNPLSASCCCLLLSIVPASLCCTMFAAYHASSTTAHKGEYKTLHCLLLTFSWCHLCTGLFTWIQPCNYCILTHSSFHHHSEFMFSWPVSCPFHILHADLWSLGQTTDHRSCYLIATMCDLTAFVILEAVSDRC
jgi:hypothetical protein